MTVPADDEDQDALAADWEASLGGDGDGDNDGAAAYDMGAYEFFRQAVYLPVIIK